MKTPLLMTGATGLVGSRFVELYGDQYDIANMDLTTGVDITQVATIEQFVTAHPALVMIHLAAFTNTGEAFKQHGDKTGLCYQVNVEGTKNIVAVCKAHHIHLIHISTDFVFDGTKPKPYVETDPPAPIEWYGETKAMAEEEVEKSGVSYTIARIAYPYRAHFDAKPDLVKKVLTGLQAGTLFPQFSDTVITPTFIDDIAKGLALFVAQKPQGIYHLVGSSSLSPYDFALEVAKAYGFDPQLVKAGSLTAYLQTNPRPFARYAKLSNAKFAQLAHWQPLSLNDGLQAVLKQQAAA